MTDKESKWGEGIPDMFEIGEMRVIKYKNCKIVLDTKKRIVLQIDVHDPLPTINKLS